MTLTVTATHRVLEEWCSGTRRTKNTAESYLYDVQDFAAWAKADSPADALCSLLREGRLGARRMAEAYEQFLAPRMAQKTTRRRISALKSFVSAARRAGLVDWPLEVVHSRALTTEQKKSTAPRNMAGPDAERFASLLASLRAQLTDPVLNLTATRDLAIVGLLQNPMLRVSEVAGLVFEDLDLSVAGAETVTVTGKAHMEPKTLPLPPGVVSDLKAWIAVRGSGPARAPVFVRIRRTQLAPIPQLTNRRLTRNGIARMTKKRGREAWGARSKKLNPHALRHSGATITAQACQEQGIPYTDGMALTRHSKMSTFLEYIDANKGATRSLVNSIEGKVRGGGPRR